MSASGSERLTVWHIVGLRREGGFAGGRISDAGLQVQRSRSLRQVHSVTRCPRVHRQRLPPGSQDRLEKGGWFGGTLEAQARPFLRRIGDAGLQVQWGRPWIHPLQGEISVLSPWIHHGNQPRCDRCSGSREDRQHLWSLASDTRASRRRELHTSSCVIGTSDGRCERLAQSPQERVWTKVLCSLRPSTPLPGAPAVGLTSKDPRILLEKAMRCLQVGPASLCTAPRTRRVIGCVLSRHHECSSGSCHLPGLAMLAAF